MTLHAELRDLTKQAPRSPRARLGGFAILARAVDKCRAELNSIDGEYHYNCPVDQELFRFKGISSEELKEKVAVGASDEQIALWFSTNGTPKTLDEKNVWSDKMESLTLYTEPGSKAWFVEECKRLNLDPEKVSLFDMLEADDKDMFSK